jgi:hypothetical protein
MLNSILSEFSIQIPAKAFEICCPVMKLVQFWSCFLKTQSFQIDTGIKNTFEILSVN